MSLVIPNLGLRIWNLGQDPYNSQQLADNFAKIDQHDHAQGRGKQLSAGSFADGSITALKLADATKLGLSDGISVRRGKSIITATETRTNTAYGLMPTPDRVSGIVLPADGLIFVAYQATWQESVQSAANAMIFLGSNPVSYPSTTTGGQTTNAGNVAGIGNATVNRDTPLSSYPQGLISTNLFGAAYAGDATTGQFVFMGSPSGAVGLGGIATIFAAAGTYDVSVQFKASSGSVTAKNRKLWVWTQGY